MDTVAANLFVSSKLGTLDVYEVFYRTEKVRRAIKDRAHLTLRLVCAPQFYLLVKVLDRFVKLTESLEFDLPNEHIELSQCHSLLWAFRMGIGEITSDLKAKKLSHEIVGKWVYGRLTEADHRLARVAATWESKLSSCEVAFAGFDEFIQSIKPGMSQEAPASTMTLARLALESSKRDGETDIDKWSRELAESIVKLEN